MFFQTVFFISIALICMEFRLKNQALPPAVWQAMAPRNAKITCFTRKRSYSA
jgi:hypothetical protein